MLTHTHVKHQSTEGVEAFLYEALRRPDHLQDKPPPGLLSGGRGLVTAGESDTMRHDGRREAERSRISTFFLNIQRQMKVVYVIDGGVWRNRNI